MENIYEKRVDYVMPEPLPLFKKFNINKLKKERDSLNVLEDEIVFYFIDGKLNVLNYAHNLVYRFYETLMNNLPEDKKKKKRLIKGFKKRFGRLK